MQIAKWGNSLALRIPAVYAKAIGISDHGTADLSIEDNKLVLKPVPEVPAFEIEALVAQITDQNRHDEVDTGPAVGGEFPG